MLSETAKIELEKSGVDRDTYVNNLLTPEQQKACVRKVDIRIVPWTAFLYVLNSLDRNNMGNVKIANLEQGTNIQKELGISETEWQAAISFFFISYVIFEIPSNLVIKRFGPARHMARIIVMWGIAAMCLGFTQNIGGIYVCRLILGIGEAGYYPGMMFLYSAWYTQKEIGTRVALFFSAASVAGAFAGLIAYGVSFMNGVGGYSGWRWIFIMEGIPSILAGVLSWFILPNFPKDSGKWLSPTEIQWLEMRLGTNAPSAHDKHFDADQFKAVFTDIHSYTFSMFYFAHVTALYGVTYYLPTIIKNLGYVSTTAQLMTVPPYIVAFVMGPSLSYNSDRTGERALHLLGLEIGFALAFVIYISVDPAQAGGTGALYFASCLGVSCMLTYIPIIWAWRSGTAKGTTHFAVCSGLMNSFGNIGGAIGSFIFRADWAPRYQPSFGIMLGFTVVAMIFIIYEGLYRHNEKKRMASLQAQAGITA